MSDLITDFQAKSVDNMLDSLFKEVDKCAKHVLRNLIPDEELNNYSIKTGVMKDAFIYTIQLFNSSTNTNTIKHIPLNVLLTYCQMDALEGTFTYDFKAMIKRTKRKKYKSKTDICI